MSEKEIKSEENKKEEVIQQEKIILTPDQRIEVLQEISVLQQLIGTVLYYPKTGLRTDPVTRKQTVVPIESVKLHYFGQQQLNDWGNRIVQLTNLL